jgi:hypothetical protein
LKRRRGNVPSVPRGEARLMADDWYFIRWRKHADLLVAMLLFVALNAILFATMKPPYAEERKSLATLLDIRDELRVLQMRAATDAEWLDFRSKSERTLAPIIADLEKTASADQPIRQHLLWAGRDNLREMLAQGERTPANSPKSDEEQESNQHVQWLEHALEEQSR